jgi:DNA-binding response OmpR family regulator
MPSILIIEDEPELVKVLRDYLENAGFSVETAYRGDTGLSLWEHKRPDLVLLDLNLPGMDGLDVAREIRRKADTPIIMLTARVEEMDQLLGLELGADDYITKPFSPRLVVSKVRAVLRRVGASASPKRIFSVADLVIDLDAHDVTREGLSFELTPTEFGLLATLAEQPGRAFTRFQLLEATQGTAFEGYDVDFGSFVRSNWVDLNYET